MADATSLTQHIFCTELLAVSSIKSSRRRIGNSSPRSECLHFAPKVLQLRWRRMLWSRYREENSVLFITRAQCSSTESKQRNAGVRTNQSGELWSRDQLSTNQRRGWCGHWSLKCGPPHRNCWQPPLSGIQNYNYLVSRSGVRSSSVQSYIQVRSKSEEIIRQV